MKEIAVWAANCNIDSHMLTQPYDFSAFSKLLVKIGLQEPII